MNLEDKTGAATLARRLALYAPHDGKFDADIPGVYIVRASAVNAEPVRAVSQLGLCIVAQGAKRVLIGDSIYEYDASRMVVYSAETPVAANIVRASRDEPYLCLVVNIDARRLAELVLRIYPHGAPRPQRPQPIYVGHSDPEIVKAGIRLMDLMAQPQQAAFLAPLVIDEILTRLLLGPVGPTIAQLGAADSNTHKIARAISWLRDHFAEPMTIEALARVAGMSASAFHQHFKAATSLSPLQFQKTLRLQEARRLMLASRADVSLASQNVSYASLSQFSREYKAFFGHPPTRDIARLHESGAVSRLVEADDF